MCLVEKRQNFIRSDFIAYTFLLAWIFHSRQLNLPSLIFRKLQHNREGAHVNTPDPHPTHTLRTFDCKDTRTPCDNSSLLYAKAATKTEDKVYYRFKNPAENLMLNMLHDADIQDFILAIFTQSRRTDCPEALSFGGVIEGSSSRQW